MADKNNLVTFVKDVYPHVKGDTIRLSSEDLKDIDNKAYVLEGEEVKPKARRAKK